MPPAEQELRADLRKLVVHIRQTARPVYECVDLLECWLRTYAGDQLRDAAGRMADRVDTRTLELLADHVEAELGAEVRALDRAFRDGNLK